MVKLPDSLRPGVFVHTCVVRAGAQGGGLRRAALAGQAAPGAPAGPVLVRGAEDLAPYPHVGCAASPAELRQLLCPDG